VASSKTSRAAVTLTAIILLAISVQGCDDVVHSLDRLPYFKMLYLEESNSSQLLVGGNDHLYSNITLTIEDDTYRENFTYYVLMTVNLSRFNLTVEVWDGDAPYFYEGKIEITVEEKKAVYVEYIPGKEGKEHSSPWKKFLENV